LNSLLQSAHQYIYQQHPNKTRHSPQIPQPVLETFSIQLADTSVQPKQQIGDEKGIERMHVSFVKANQDQESQLDTTVKVISDGPVTIHSYPHIERYYHRKIQSKEDEKYSFDIEYGPDGEKIREDIQPDWNILTIVKKCPPDGWHKIFKECMPELDKLSQLVKGDENIYGRCYPLRKNIFRVFELCKPEDIKVIIFGQDPYHSTDHDGQPTAQGLSFSVRINRGPPPSLQNIYKVLSKTVEGFHTPTHGDLTSWVKQGVFMLNTALTVRPHAAGSHVGWWSSFTHKVVKAIIARNDKIVFMLWGRKAQDMEDVIGNKGRILKTSHPSPFSARRGFLQCNHFNQANEYLEEHSKKPIDWQVY